MHLKLDSLQRLLDRTLAEERFADELRTEVKRVLGPAVIVEGKSSEVAAAANDRLDVLDRTGRSGGLDWQHKLAVTWSQHVDPEVRKLAARAVNERFLPKMARDGSATVRAVVARRATLDVVTEMVKRFPSDDQLRSTLRQRRLGEAGITKPKVVPMGHDPSDGKEPLGKSTRSLDVPDLTETWYHEQAQRLVHEYDGKMECSWEERAVHRFCASAWTTSRVEIDEARLLKSVKGIIKEKEDMAMERDALSETLEWLSRQEEMELLEENAIPHFKESHDPVENLADGGLTGERYLEAAARVFKVQESIMPLGIRKYRLGEGNARQTMVPCVGQLPHESGFRPVDERALDAFCETWNRKQRQQGEPLCIQWSAHPGAVGKVSFTCSLR